MCFDNIPPHDHGHDILNDISEFFNYKVRMLAVIIPNSSCKCTINFRLVKTSDYLNSTKHIIHT